MIIECPECSARFKVSDSKIKPSGTKVRCARCDFVFKVFPSGLETLDAVPSVAPAPPRRSTDPFALDDPFEQTQGPVAAAAMMAPGRREGGVRAAGRPEALFGAVDDEEGFAGSGLSNGDNPFERDDPFARTAFGADEAPADGFGESRFDLDDLPAASQFEAQGGDRGAAFSATQGGGAFMRGSDLNEPSHDDEGGDEFVVERYSHFGGRSQESGGESPVGVVPGLESTSEAVSALMGRDQPDRDGFEGGVDGDVSLLGDPRRAQAMLAGAEDASEGAEVGDGLFGVDDGPYFDPSVGGVVRPGSDAQEGVRGGGDSAPVEASGDDVAKPVAPRESRQRRPERTRERKSRRARQREGRRAQSNGLGLSPGNGVGPARVIQASEPVVRRDGGVLQMIANLFLIMLLVMLGFLGFVAWKNDGLLDFYALDDMVAAAFDKGAYTPRGEEEVEARAPGAAPEEKALVIKELEQLHFPNKRSEPLFILEGRVVNQTDSAVRGVVVQGKVFDGDKKAIGEGVAPTGRTLSEDELLEIVDEDSLKGAYEVIKGEAKALDVPAGQAVGFSLVLLGLPEADQEGARSFKVTVKDFKASPEVD